MPGAINFSCLFLLKNITFILYENTTTIYRVLSPAAIDQYRVHGDPYPLYLLSYL